MSNFIEFRNEIINVDAIAHIEEEYVNCNLIFSRKENFVWVVTVHFIGGLCRCYRECRKADFLKATGIQT